MMGGERQTAARVLPVLAAIAVGLTALARAAAAPHEAERRLALFTSLLARGEPYVTLTERYDFHMQPPGIFLLMTWLGGLGLAPFAAARLIAFTALCGTAYIAARGAGAGGRHSAAVVLIILVPVGRLFAVDFRTEMFVLMLLLTVMAAALRAHAAGGRRWLLGAAYGALALSALFKGHVPFVVFMCALGAAWLVRRRGGEDRAFGGPILTHAALGAAALALAALVAALALGDAFPRLVRLAIFRASPALDMFASAIFGPLRGGPLLPSAGAYHAESLRMFAVTLPSFLFNAFPFSVIALAPLARTFARGAAPSPDGIWLAGGAAGVLLTVMPSGDSSVLLIAPPIAALAVGAADGMAAGADARWRRAVGWVCIAAGAGVAVIVTLLAALGPRALGLEMDPGDGGFPELAWFDATFGLILAVIAAIYLAAGAALSRRDAPRAGTVVVALAFAICAGTTSITLHEAALSDLGPFVAEVRRATGGGRVVLGEGTLYTLQAHFPDAGRPGPGGGPQWTIMDAREWPRWTHVCEPPAATAARLPATSESLILARCRHAPAGPRP